MYATVSVAGSIIRKPRVQVVCQRSKPGEGNAQESGLSGSLRNRRNMRVQVVFEYRPAVGSGWGNSERKA